MHAQGDEPTDRKIRCPRDGTVMHKFRVPIDPISPGQPVSASRPDPLEDPGGEPCVVLDRCHVCRGFWVDLGELTAVLSQSAVVTRLAEHRPPPEHSEETLDCPRCHTQLVRLRHHEQRHVKLDSCTVCGGIFFDAQELTDLSAFTLLERIRAFFD